MHKPYDQLSKSLAGRILEDYARVELEHEVPHMVQLVDILFEPDGRVPAVPLGGWLGRIATAGPGLLECFSHTVRPEELRSCIYKRDGLYHAHVQRSRKDGLPRPALPHLWITTAGRPHKMMRAHDAAPLSAWPPGFWTLRRGDGLRIVVLPELPEDHPDTLLLRLMGRGATLRQALLEVANLPPGSPLDRVLEPFLVAFRPHILQDLELYKDANMNVLEQVQAMYSRWEQETSSRARKQGRKEGRTEGRTEGRKEGRKEGRQQERKETLLWLLEQRFAVVPETVRVRVAQASTEELARWYQRVLAAATVDDVFAD